MTNLRLPIAFLKTLTPFRQYCQSTDQNTFNAPHNQTFKVTLCAEHVLSSISSQETRKGVGVTDCKNRKVFTMSKAPKRINFTTTRTFTFVNYISKHLTKTTGTENYVNYCF